MEKKKIDGMEIPFNDAVVQFWPVICQTTNFNLIVLVRVSIVKRHCDKNNSYKGKHLNKDN